MQIKCTNHNCQLNNACQNYHNRTGEEKYIRPQIIFNDFDKPKMRCEFLWPLNTEYIVRQSKMNDLRNFAIAAIMAILFTYILFGIVINKRSYENRNNNAQSISKGG
jgi:hypothetical protein